MLNGRFINDDFTPVPCRTAMRISKQEFIQKVLGKVTGGYVVDEEFPDDPETGESIRNVKIEAYTPDGRFITDGHINDDYEIVVKDWPDGDFIIRLTNDSRWAGKVPDLFVENESTKADFAANVFGHLLYNDEIVRQDKGIDVDHENIEKKADKYWEKYYPGIGKHLGFHTINGLTYFGALTAGDWETMLFLMFYWDGENIRCYVPKRGNMVNLHTMTALGSECHAMSTSALLDKHPEWREYVETQEEYDPYLPWDEIYMSMYGLEIMKNGEFRYEIEDRNRCLGRFYDEKMSLFNADAIEEDFLTAIQVID